MRGDGAVYGLRIEGLLDASHLMSTARASDPVLRVERTRTTSGREPMISADRARLPLSDAISWADLDRRSGVVRLELGAEYRDEELLHPLLSGACAVSNLWHGRDAFHAGAFVVAGRAWGVIGHKGQGKSTTLGYLALRDFPVLSDDVVVEEAGVVRPGPAFVDLRPDAAAHLAVGRDMGVLGARPRFRLDTPVVSDDVPLAGWLLLGWGERTALTPLPSSQRIATLLENRAVLLAPAAPGRLLDHAALPFYRLTRPQRWSSLPEVADLVAGLASG